MIMTAIVIILVAMAIITVTVVHGRIRRWMPGGHMVMINAEANFLLRFPFGLLQMASSPPERCTICRRRYKPHHQLSLLRRCGHVFHARCILPWLASNRRCPLCRRHVDGGHDDMTSTTETTSTGDANHTSNNNHSTAATHGSSTDDHDMASSSSEASSENHLSIDTMAATYGSSTDHMASSSSLNQPSIDTTAATFGSSTEDMASSVASSATPAPPPPENEIVPEVVPILEGESEGYRSSAQEEVGVSDSEEVVSCSCSPCCCFGLSTICPKKVRGPGSVSGSAQSSHVGRSVRPPGCFSRFLKPNEFSAHGGSTSTHQPNMVRAVSRFFSRCFNYIKPKKDK